MGITGDALSFVFAPVLDLPVYISVFIMAVILTFVSTLFYKYLINQEKVRELKERQKRMQKEIEELQKVDPEEAKKKMSEMFKHTNEIMKMSFKPMILTMVLVILFFPWMSSVFKEPILLPFSLPVFGNSIGWIVWYFINSILLTTLFRKILGVE